MQIDKLKMIQAVMFSAAVVGLGSALLSGVFATTSNTTKWDYSGISESSQVTDRVVLLEKQVEALQTQIDRLTINGNSQATDSEQLSDAEQRLTELENRTASLKAITPVASSEFQLLVLELDRVGNQQYSRAEELRREFEKKQAERDARLDSILNFYQAIFGWAIAGIFLLVAIAFAVMYFTVQSGIKDKKKRK